MELARALPFLTLLLAAAAAADEARPATTLRYALVVGNDHGELSGQSLVDLRSAERDAAALRKELVRLGAFDPTGERTELVLGGGRADILAAARRLAERRAADAAQLGPDTTSLFAFFFSGHGVDEQLLTKDAPLTPADLAVVFREMDATLTIGVFDACFSGSFDLDALRAKGIASTPGFNAFDALPRETLQAEGAMWFTSSERDQVSYEDERVGGVFLHYFQEGMQRAPGDGVGITIDEIWEYARKRTQEHTRRAGRPQSPQKLVQRLQASGPLYFTFPQGRTSTIAFARDVAGTFVVRYGRGAFAEVIEKRAGAAQAVPMFAAEIVLERLKDESGPGWSEAYVLERGRALRIDAALSDARSTGLGERAVPLAAKGASTTDGVVVTRVEARPTALIEAAYTGGLATTLGSMPLAGASAGLRIDAGAAFGRLGLAWGRGFELMPARPAFTLDRVDLEYSAGPAFDVGPLRLGAELSGVLSGRLVTTSSRSSPGWSAGLGVGANATWALFQWPAPVYLTARAGVRGEYAAPVLPASAPMQLGASPWLSIGVATRIL